MRYTAKDIGKAVFLGISSVLANVVAVLGFAAAVGIALSWNEAGTHLLRALIDPGVASILAIIAALAMMMDLITKAITMFVPNGYIDMRYIAIFTPLRYAIVMSLLIPFTSNQPSALQWAFTALL